MKRIIVGLIFISSLASAADLPKSCQALKDLGGEVVANSIQREKIAAKAISFVSEVIELKFRMVNFLEENREIYGRYVSLTEQKDEVDASIKSYEEARQTTIERFNNAVKEIDPKLSERMHRKVFWDLKRQKRKDLRLLKGNLKVLARRKSKLDPVYFDIVSEWSPYREYLNQLDEIENNLLLTLDALKEIDIFRNTSLSTSVSILRSFNLDIFRDGQELISSKCQTAQDVISILSQDLVKESL